MIRRRTAWWIAGAWMAIALGMIVIPVVWGGTVTRCKPAGFVDRAALLKADLDCLDTRVLNEFNSQITDTNIRASANIAFSKVDPTTVFLTSLTVTTLSSSDTITIMAPSVRMSRLESSGPIVMAAPTLTLPAILTSTFSVTLAAPSLRVGRLESLDSLTIGAPRLTVSALDSSGAILVSQLRGNCGAAPSNAVCFSPTGDVYASGNVFANGVQLAGASNTTENLTVTTLTSADKITVRTPTAMVVPRLESTRTMVIAAPALIAPALISVQTLSLVSNTPGGAVPTPNTLFANNFPKAFGSTRWQSIGNSVPEVLESFNYYVTNDTSAVGLFSVLFATNMAGVNYTVACSVETATVAAANPAWIQVFNKGQSGFSVRTWNSASGEVDIPFSCVVFGQQ